MIDFGFKTHTRQVEGRARVMRVSDQLILLKLWFALNPLPTGELFEFTVKREDGKKLDHVILAEP